MYSPARRAFTLIELLVVIAIIAILSVVVILTLNPAELLRQSRDSNRLSDVDTLNHAISLYSTDQSAAASFNMGSSSIIYVSTPDPTATSTAGDQCQGLGLPIITASSGYAYHCAASSTYRNINGTGWIPINFSNITSGSPLGNLPVDALNQSSSRSYYTYTTNGTQYEITAAMESQKYDLGGSSDVVSTDGGSKMSLLEKGTNLTLEPLDYGDASLVTYWPLDEGSGTIAYDFSGNGNNGTWTGTQAGLNSTYYTNAKVGAFAGYTNGSNDQVASPSWAPPITNYTWSTWFSPGINWNTSTTNVYSIMIGSYINANNRDQMVYANTGALQVTIGNAGSFTTVINYPSTYSSGTWYMTTLTRNGNNFVLYINGVAVSSSTNAVISPTGNRITYLSSDGSGNHANTSFDDARFYNRALSAAEVLAIYNGEH